MGEDSYNETTGKISGVFIFFFIFFFFGKCLQTLTI
jgi:hypothetical protein